tara:strand:+ start:230 stop:367 length:138 start_codon:yes stop_codon:yes gene_type:complete
MPKKITHLSLFDNDTCVVCGKEVKDNALHCEDCLYKWLETKQENK